MCPPLDSAPTGGTSLLDRTEEATKNDTPWQVLLHNDPVNLVTYVTATLVAVLDVSVEKAEQLMLTAHTEGKAAVFAGTFPEAENIMTRLQAHTLWATLEKSGS